MKADRKPRPRSSAQSSGYDLLACLELRTNFGIVLICTAKFLSWMKGGDVHQQHERRSIRKVIYFGNRGQAP